MIHPRKGFTLFLLIMISWCTFYDSYLNIGQQKRYRNANDQLESLNKEILAIEKIDTLRQAHATASSVGNSREKRCLLQIPDPWDSSIRHLFPNETRDYSAPTLSKGTTLITKFSDGILSVLDDKYKCQYPCIKLGQRNKQRYYDWIDVKFPDANVATNSYRTSQNNSAMENTGTEVEEISVRQTQVAVSCEFFEVRCDEKSKMQSNDTSFDYRMPYAQAVQKEFGVDRTENGTYRPSVIIIVLDSASHSSAVRRLPKTLKYLKEQFNSTIFNGYAKVGLNSNPNAVAFLTGKMKETPFGKDIEIQPNSDVTQHIIWKEYKKRNYVTYFSEDDVKNPIFDLFDTPPTDHFLTALPQAYHRIGLGYLNQVLQMYQSNPLFVLSWMGQMSHDQIVDLDDAAFLEFFQKSESILKDSFVILMGDHGMRFGDLRSTAVGRLEDNLPFFSIALPEVLRNRVDINENLKRNSQILTNHFDLYVTLWDILTSNFDSRFSQQLDWKSFTKATHGLSLLRPIPSDRTCQSLEMPLEYCPCYEPTKKSTDTSLHEKLAQFAVDVMNEVLENSVHGLRKGYSCEKIFLNKILDVEELVEQSFNYFYVYRMVLTTIPNNGTFQAFLRYDRISDSITNAAHFIDRINSYGNMPYCIMNHSAIRYCLCKKK